MNVLKTNQKSIWLLVAILTLQVFLFGEVITQPADELSGVPVAELVEQSNRSETLYSVGQILSSHVHTTSNTLTSNFLFSKTISEFTYRKLIHTQLMVAFKRVLSYDLPIFLSHKIITHSSTSEDIPFLLLS